jgi:hypothetical protein
MTHAQVQNGLAIASVIIAAVSHMIAMTGTPKWLPPSIVTLINLIAANYGKSKNKDDRQ